MPLVLEGIMQRWSLRSFLKLKSEKMPFNNLERHFLFEKVIEKQ